MVKKTGMFNMKNLITYNNFINEGVFDFFKKKEKEKIEYNYHSIRIPLRNFTTRYLQENIPDILREYTELVREGLAIRNNPNVYEWDLPKLSKIEMRLGRLINQMKILIEESVIPFMQENVVGETIRIKKRKYDDILKIWIAWKYKDGEKEILGKRSKRIKEIKDIKVVDFKKTEYPININIPFFHYTITSDNNDAYIVSRRQIEKIEIRKEAHRQISAIDPYGEEEWEDVLEKYKIKSDDSVFSTDFKINDIVKLT